MSQKIVPFLWFNGNAVEAAKFYTSIFKKSKAKIVDHDPMSATFQIDGVEFVAFNGGPMFKFTPAMSLFVSCKDQKEIDYYWTKLLSGGGKPSHCGWLTDKFGVSWQVIPECLSEFLGDSDREKADRALAAMMKMKKFDIAKLKKAHSGKR